jgi:hypothetical protein
VLRCLNHTGCDAGCDTGRSAHLPLHIARALEDFLRAQSGAGTGPRLTRARVWVHCSNAGCGDLWSSGALSMPSKPIIAAARVVVGHAK